MVGSFNGGLTRHEPRLGRDWPLSAHVRAIARRSWVSKSDVSMSRLLHAAVLVCGLMTNPCLAGSASNAALNEAAATLKRRRLLGAAELACSTFVYEGNEKGVHAVAVREKHDRKCGGDPDIAPIRFHMQIDRKRNRVLWDNNLDVEMRPIP